VICASNQTKQIIKALTSINSL